MTHCVYDWFWFLYTRSAIKIDYIWIIGKEGEIFFKSLHDENGQKISLGLYTLQWTIYIHYTFHKRKIDYLTVCERFILLCSKEYVCTSAWTQYVFYVRGHWQDNTNFGKNHIAWYGCSMFVRILCYALSDRFLSKSTERIYQAHHLSWIVICTRICSFSSPKKHRKPSFYCKKQNVIWNAIASCHQSTWA